MKDTIAMLVRYKTNNQNWSLFRPVYIRVTLILKFDTNFHQIALVSKGTSCAK